MSDDAPASELQEALDRSIRSATPFTRSLFETDQWGAERVARFVNANRNVTIATVTFAGEPHAAVVICACADGAIHFTVASRSLMARNLAHSPHVAFTISDRTHAVMGKGVAVLVGRSLDDPALIERLAAATERGTFTPPGWDGLVYRIEVDRIFAN
ncbi:MAG: pyridoxamine 5'-phosphate oxidase family protein [Ilumatobacteraceae bacterium]